MKLGIEFEYLLHDGNGRIRDFTNLDFRDMEDFIAPKPGRDDPSLATGDLGIKAGYWYLEGDERFDGAGNFSSLAVKGVEIRTPPRSSVVAASACLLDIQAELAARLAQRDLHLSLVGFNPLTPRYEFSPPLNPWERACRAAHPEYGAAGVSTLSYGPDINVSFPGWDGARCLAATRRLTFYSPFMVPFSFSSPFYAGKPWSGLSKRTFERTWRRPSAKCFGSAADRRLSPLMGAARLPSEQGRIEFKAYDAFTDLSLLEACCHLVAGVCLAEDLAGQADTPDKTLHQLAATRGFAEPRIAHGAALVLARAGRALVQHGLADAHALDPLADYLAQGRTPAHDLLAAYAHTGLMYVDGGLVAPMPRPQEAQARADLACPT